MINVLTIEREYGSGAAEIAQKLADRLGWKLWDQLLTDEIARHMECDSEHIEQHGGAARSALLSSLQSLPARQL